MTGAGQPTADALSRVLPVLRRAGRRLRARVDVVLSIRAVKTLGFELYPHGPQIAAPTMHEVESHGGPIMTFRDIQGSVVISEGSPHVYELKRFLGTLINWTLPSSSSRSFLVGGPLASSLSRSSP